jgi:hypothetical protein
VTYWLVNSGTVEDPYRAPRDNIAYRFRVWEVQWGNVQFFDRAYKMRPGDALIHRAVGSKGRASDSRRGCAVGAGAQRA